jgi:hypothetical protein
MIFTGYVVRRGVSVGPPTHRVHDAMELLLYNGKKIIVRGPSYAHPDTIVPGDLIQFYYGTSGHDNIDLEAQQEPDTFYDLGKWVSRITNQETIQSFMIGARIFMSPPAEFPRFGIKIEGKVEYVTESNAVRLLESGSIRTELSGYVLDSEFCVRPIYPGEKPRLESLCDEYSGSK